MSILQKHRAFRSRNGGSSTSSSLHLGDRGDSDILAAGNCVAFSNHINLFRRDEFSLIDVGAIGVVGRQSAAAGINTGAERGAVHVSR